MPEEQNSNNEDYKEPKLVGVASVIGVVVGVFVFGSIFNILVGFIAGIIVGTIFRFIAERGAYK